MNQDKEYIKLRLATALRILLQKNKKIALKNKVRDIEDVRLVESLRQLEAESGISYNVIQSSFTGKRDIQFSTLINIVESLGYKFSEFSRLYEKITQSQIDTTKKEIENKRVKV